MHIQDLLLKAAPLALSLSSSTVSRRCIRASSRKLKELMERRLDKHGFTAIVMDGKTFGEDDIIMAVGVAIEGRKVILGIIQSSLREPQGMQGIFRRYTEGIPK